MDLKGRRALVTGANGGVGTAVVRRFLNEGMKVAGVVRSGPATGLPAKLVVLQGDVTQEADVARLFSEADAALGGIDIVVHTVGGYASSNPVADLPVADWDRMMDLNLRSTFLCIREALRHMKGRPYGRIVNFSAQTGLQPAAGKSAYAVSKSGVSLLTEIVAKEVRKEGITINAIAPGIVDTPANRASMPDADFSTWVSPDDIADTICWLCLEQTVVNGTTLKAYGRLP